MPVQVGLSTPHLNIYHQRNSLLFQFILFEFIASYHEVLTIHHLSGKLKKNRDQHLIASLKVSIAKLSGTTLSHMRLFSWNIEEGVLSRLKNYCAFLSQSGDKSSKDPSDMHRYANRAWLNCIQCLDLLYLDDELESLPQDNHALHSGLTKIVTYMKRFSKIAARMMQTYHQDENVIFFLLRHHDRLDELFGPQFVFKLLSRMYPNGLQGASSFLIERYTKRGFFHILPFISRKISELQTN